MKLKAMIAAALAGGMALAGTPSHAAGIVAVPGAGIAGYPQPVAVAPQGTLVQFANLDPLDQHNVVSVARKPGTTQPLFESLFAAGGEVVAVTGTDELPVGEYPFVCAPHSTTMKGTLQIT